MSTTSGTKRAPRTRVSGLEELGLSELVIDDAAVVADLALYRDLKAILRSGDYRFRVLPSQKSLRWDRALFLNLTFWGGQGGDVLPDRRIAADVVTHVAWHHLAARALSERGTLSVDALFLGESIASAFDLYLVGRLLARPAGRGGTRAGFLETQVPAMAETAAQGGLSVRGFEKLLHDIAADPSRAFEDLRALLFDVTRALFACEDAVEGLGVLDAFGAHRFAPLLHRHELSNWVLWTRAWAGDRTAPDLRAREIDRALRAAPDAVAWLTNAWVEPHRVARTPTTAPAKKLPAKKLPAKKLPAKKLPAKKLPAKKLPAKKPSTRSAPKRR